MDYNFHTHTWRCSHATGTEEEYIIRALENGVKYMGFSDHIPFRCPDGTEVTSTRIPISQAKDYCKNLRELREKYRGKIEIYIGFESEYYPEYFKKMVSDAREWGAEYLILGQHYTSPERPSGRRSFVPTDNPDDLEDYAQSLVNAMKTGVFTYVAHPDVINFKGDRETYQKIMRKVCISSREQNVPLEINFLGIRDNRYYPNEAFWQIASQEQSPVTFGFDAHASISAYDSSSLEIALDMVEKFKLNYIGKPNLILI